LEFTKRKLTRKKRESGQKREEEPKGTHASIYNGPPQNRERSVNHLKVKVVNEPLRLAKNQDAEYRVESTKVGNDGRGIKNSEQHNRREIKMRALLSDRRLGGRLISCRVETSGENQKKRGDVKRKTSKGRKRDQGHGLRKTFVM